MHIHILGICGTFMGGLAVLARQLGHRVSGSDSGVYPPMSEQLAAQGIALQEGYDPAHLKPAPDLVVVGNALSRGNPAVEYVLEQGLPYTSGPAFLAEHVLAGRWVLAVAGTHGKTTTTAMLAWILEAAGLAPGFLIGGAALGFPASARLGSAPFFVVEADEYDSAFFDKRSKFIHYRPRTLILNNLEYDHADIFPDLEAIKLQFQHLLRTVPGNGLVVMPRNDAALAEVVARGCWTPLEYLDEGGGWRAGNVSADLRAFDVCLGEACFGRVSWELQGMHNIHNALAAVAAARHGGVPPAVAVEALGRFRGVRRRMELRGEVRGVAVYDDFAHHPGAIATTLAGLRRRVGDKRILAVLEPRSNTMRMGVHAARLPQALAAADEVLIYGAGELGFDPAEVAAALGGRGRVFASLDEIVEHVRRTAAAGDHILVMSNGDFGGIHQRILEALAQQ
ncbi:MAG TPA: UDP-N-acetylmuramate:L-alanyl-gamma-D-glutamyl-meso-diaminopimelate ligase [Gammaproteobacteria bacterium]|nr:UDP-N-acetylmuramate:L-alanyl-gamma-D-glutamyl-meso-diaminopimelate ligase [Gammaproteobacteria bacterium]